MSVIFRIIYISLFATLLLQACGGLDDNDFIDSDELARRDDVTINNFLSDNNITAERDGGTGIYYTVDVENNAGESGSGKICGIYYKVSLLEGESFDEHNPTDGESILLKQGSNAILPFGLDFGLNLMNTGETFTFYLPSKYAFGGLGFSNIVPGNSILKLEVTLDRVMNAVDLLQLETAIIDEFIEDNELNDLDKNPVDEVQSLNSGVRFKKLQEGTGTEAPQTGQRVGVSYKGTFLDGKIFDETTEDVIFRYNFDRQEVIPGFDQGIGQLKLGEKGLIIIPSNSAYGQSVRVIPAFFKSDLITNRIIPGYVGSIDPYSILLFEIELKEIQ